MVRLSVGNAPGWPLFKRKPEWSSVKKHCCEYMQYHATYRCDQHPNPFDCPDNVVIYDAESDSYYLIIHDGGSGLISIRFCPWCGSNIETKRKIKRRLRFGTRTSKHRKQPV